MEAMQRACQMINQLDAGDVVSGVIDIYPDPAKKQVITASCEKIARRAGVDIPADDTERILKELFFDVERDGDKLTVTVPDFRQDVEGEADLCEEALRVYGYDKIPSTLLRGETTPGGRSDRMRLKDEVSHVLTAMGFYEIMNYSFVSPKSVDKLMLDEKDARRNMLPIRNPLGEDTSVMRTTLVPDMLSTLALNMNHGNDSARLFEVAAVFDPASRTAEGLPTETRKLCLGLYSKDADFFTMRGVVERLLKQLGIAFDVSRSDEVYLHPGRQAKLTQGDQVVCVLGEVHPTVRENFDMPYRALIAEMDMEVIAQLQTPMGAVKPMPRYPAVSRDLSLVMAESTEVGPLLADMAHAAGSILEDAKMFDVYRSVAVGKDMKSVAFSFVFRAADHTLTEAEITKAMEKLQKVAADKYQAVIRG